LNNAEVIEYLKIAGVVVFFLLSFVFYKMAKKKMNSNKVSPFSNSFLKGVGMSAINMLAIPFYLGMSIYLASEGSIIIEHPFILFFIIGAAIGSFLLFFTYIALAKIIENRISFIARNINYILSALFLLLGILTFYKILQPN
jgi:threonine/homoserine/homoserine lactone efflux protein